MHMDRPHCGGETKISHVSRQETRYNNTTADSRTTAAGVSSVAMSRAATAVSSGLDCCCLTQCCNCVNLRFLKTTEGIIKLAEVILGAVCQNLLISYGLTYHLTLGSSYYSFLTTVSSSLMTALVLLLCYVISHNTYQLVRQSLFETLFNGISCFLYISSSCYLAFAVYTFLYPLYKITAMFEVYPAMSGTYILGFILGAIHGYDSYLAYKKYH